MANRLLRTESFRLAAIFAALFIGSSLIVTVLVYVTVKNAFESVLLHAAEHDVSVIQKDYASEGLGEATETISERLAKPSSSDYFLLEDGRGRRIAGNLPPMPPKEGVLRLAAPATATGDDDEGEDHVILGRGVFIAPAVYAFAGRDLYIAAVTERRVLRMIGRVLGATLVIAIGGGVLLSASVLRRMDAITRTCRAIMAGHLSDRVPIRGTRDALDELASVINSMLDRIGALMDNVRQISSDIAHDLRTPLTRSRHHLELARSEARTEADYAEAIDRAIADSDAVLATFSALLRIGQIEAGAERVAFETVDLALLLRELVEMYKPVAEDGGRRLTVATLAEAEVDGDHALLRQLFANIIENALTHTPDGSDIRIALETGEGKIAVIISDNGPGIPPEEREKVFRRFYRLERGRTTPGSGLGLALAAAIAQHHGAKITLCDNAPGLRVVVAFERTPSPSFA